MDYYQELVWLYEREKTGGCPQESRVDFIADYVFGITTYDGEMSETIGAKAIEVFRAITNGSTIEYIKDAENYQWYIIVCNLPFFINRIEWGTSIRGAWWDEDQEFVIGHNVEGRWNEFAHALLKFADER